MKAKEWATATAPLVPRLAGFRPMPRGYVRSEGWVAECLFAESSAFAKEVFYVQAFPLPLFVPTERVYFNYGFRVGGRWEDVDEALFAAIEAALPKLQGLATIDGLLSRAHRPATNIRHAELHLCAAVIRGDSCELEIARQRIEGWTPTVDWVQSIVARCLEFLAVIDAGGASAGLRELERRRDQVMTILQ